MARAKKAKAEAPEESKACEECGASVIAWRCGAGFRHSVVCEKCHTTRYPNHEV